MYVFLGPVTPAAMSLSQAPIVFFGEAASRAAGAALAAGDINRDALKNDLVISAPGGAGGAGEAASITAGAVVPSECFSPMAGASSIWPLRVRSTATFSATRALGHFVRPGLRGHRRRCA